MDASEAIEAVEWIATDYIKPHEYIVFHQNDEAFMVIAEAIRKGAVAGEFLGHKYRYWFHGNFKYWHMGVIINRTRIDTIAA